jgi:glycosyltransferase involved in cell wall biosynthesis
MVTKHSINRPIILNGLFLDKIGKQSGTYFMAISIIRQLLEMNTSYMLITTEEFDWASGRTIQVKPFPKKLRFVVESYYRNKLKRNTWLHFDYFLPFQLPKSKGKDVVIIHDLLPLDVINSVPKLKKIWFRLQVQRAILMSDSIITISNFSKQRIEHHFSKINSNLTVISNPVDLDRFNAEVQQEPKGEKVRYFSTISAPWPHKNLNTILCAFQEIWMETEIQLYVCGARESEIANKDYLNHESVKFLGFVSNSELAKIIKNSEAFIAPSLYEGFGMTVYEALALGKFVLASDLEVYRQHPLLIRVGNPENEESWSHAIKKFLKMKKNIIKFDFDEFHPYVIATQYDELIKGVDAKNFE